MGDTVATVRTYYRSAGLADVLSADQAREVRRTLFGRRRWFVGYDSMNYEFRIRAKAATIKDHSHLRMFVPNRGKNRPWYTIARKREGEWNRFHAG